MSPEMIDMTGKKYGRLTAIKPTKKKNRKWLWLFKCDCGKTKEIIGIDVRNGQSRSCGCRLLEAWGVSPENAKKRHLTKRKPQILDDLDLICDCGAIIDTDGNCLYCSPDRIYCSEDY